MSRYCTVPVLREALTPLGATPGDTRTAADLPDPQLQNAIDEASSVVDAAIGARYTTPVAPVEGVIPHPVDFWARNIAAYLATCTYRGSVDFTDNDPVYRRYVTTQTTLNDIKKGIGTLPLPPVGDAGGAGGGAGQPVNPYSGNLFEASDFDLEYPRDNYLNDPRRVQADRGWW